MKKGVRAFYIEQNEILVSLGARWAEIGALLTLYR